MSLYFDLCQLHGQIVRNSIDCIFWILFQLTLLISYKLQLCRISLYVEQEIQAMFLDAYWKIDNHQTVGQFQKEAADLDQSK